MFIDIGPPVSLTANGSTVPRGWWRPSGTAVFCFSLTSAMPGRSPVGLASLTPLPEALRARCRDAHAAALDQEANARDELKKQHAAVLEASQQEQLESTQATMQQRADHEAAVAALLRAGAEKDKAMVTQGAK